MARKETIIYVIKLIAEIAVLVLLSLVIIYLIRAENGLLANGEKSTAEEKVDEAIKIFSSTDGMTMEEALRQIEGLENLVVNEETGEYEVIVDGQEFFVVSQELVPEDSEESQINTNEVTNNDETN